MNKISIGTRLKYYKRPEIQQAMVKAAKDKEIAVKFGSSGYGKRPDTITYPMDILEFAKKGVTSFHCSEELWDNPLLLGPKLSRKDQEELRIGWDLMLDIDCTNIELAKICAVLLINALQYHGIKSIAVKFSGNNGFHIGVPYEAFPKIINDVPTSKLFPDLARKVAGLLKEMVEEPLRQELAKKFTIKQLQELAKKPDDVIKNKTLNPYAVLEIDTILISPRHLYRMPYSLHEKSGFASTPLRIESIPTFQREDAHPDKVTEILPYWDRKNARPEEGTKLLLQALDFKVKEDPLDERLKKKTFQPIDLLGFAAPEEIFPPCIKLILQGLEDGKKRAMFVLLNFMVNVGWDYDKIEARFHEWNKVNPEPLREVIILGQLRHHKQNRKKILPPNCDNAAYYKDLGVCKPDALCAKIKNPLNYTLRKIHWMRREGLIKSDKDVNQVNKEGQKEGNREITINKDDPVNQVNTKETRLKNELNIKKQGA